MGGAVLLSWANFNLLAGPASGFPDDAVCGTASRSLRVAAAYDKRSRSEVRPGTPLPLSEGGRDGVGGSPGRKPL